MTDLPDPLDIAGDLPALEAESRPETTGDDPEVLQRVRDLVLQAHREVVPELVVGASLTELLASIEPARAAYANLATRIEADRLPEPPNRRTKARWATASEPPSALRRVL